MTTAMRTRFPEILSKYEKDLLDDWIQNQLSATTLRSDLMKESELREQSREFLSALREESLSFCKPSAQAEIRAPQARDKVARHGSRGPQRACSLGWCLGMAEIWVCRNCRGTHSHIWRKCRQIWGTLYSMSHS